MVRTPLPQLGEEQGGVQLQGVHGGRLRGLFLLSSLQKPPCLGPPLPPHSSLEEEGLSSLFLPPGFMGPSQQEASIHEPVIIGA